MSATKIFFPALFAGLAFGHTWLEQLSVVQDGTYVGDFGYPRGYVARTDAGYDGDAMSYLNPPHESGRTRIDNTDLLCHPSQRAAEQSSDEYPRLQAAAGSYVALRYLENGHVSLPDAAPAKAGDGGTVFVFGTAEPREDEKLAEVLEWTADGSGGDGRGRLLTAQSYDDGRCYQINGSPISEERKQQYAAAHPDTADQAELEQWCETDVQLPEDAKDNDAYTLYWVWQWTSEPGVDPGLPDGKDEYYTTCMDVDITAGTGDASTSSGSNGNGGGSGETKYPLVQQSQETKAVDNYKARAAHTGDDQSSPPPADKAPSSSAAPSPAPSPPDDADDTDDADDADNTPAPPAPTASQPAAEAPVPLYTTMVTHIFPLTVYPPEATPPTDAEAPVDEPADEPADDAVDNTAVDGDYKVKRRSFVHRNQRHRAPFLPGEPLNAPTSTKLHD